MTICGTLCSKTSIKGQLFPNLVAPLTLLSGTLVRNQCFNVCLHLAFYAASSSIVFLKIFFWCDLPLLAVFIIFVLFCHQVVNFIHLVFRQTQELNSCPRTMAQIVSPRHSPLDQGAFPCPQILTLTMNPIYRRANKRS